MGSDFYKYSADFVFSVHFSHNVHIDVVYCLYPVRRYAIMFEDIGDIVKRRFVSAFHTVVHSFTEFLPFCLTMFAIIFALLTASFFVTQGYATEKADMEAAYDYHVAVKGLDQSQMITIRDDALTVFRNDFCYKSVYVEKHTYNGNTSYDVYLRLMTGNKNYGFKGLFIEDTLQSNLNTFLKRYNSVIYPESEAHSGIRVITSPLYDLEAHASETKQTKILALLVISVIAMLLLIGVYSVRVNNQKFLYGIYSTFGADRRRLCATSTYEILICSAFVFIPALICSILCCRHAFADTSTGFHFSFSAMLWTIPFLFVIVLAGTYFPLKVLSMQEPMSMIVADDNSNLVSSPSRSANMLRVNSSLKYEGLTLVRFRNRTLKLLAMSAIFCAMFISGLYLADVYILNAEIDAKTSAAFTVEIPSDVTENAIINFESVDGVREVHGYYRSCRADLISSHILVEKSDTKLLSGCVTYKKNRNYKATNSCSYIPADSEDVLEQFGNFYTVEGDLSAVLTDPHTVAIGSSKDNRDVYKFKVGDTIRIANVTISQRIDYLQGLALLKQQLALFEFEYFTVTIGAIIHDYPSALYGTPVIMSADLYDTLTGDWGGTAQNALAVYLDDGLTGTDVDNIEFALRDIAEAYKNVAVTPTGTYHDSLIQANKQYPSLFMILAICVLILVPIIWFFSQILFYNRRSTEFDILMSIAATEKSIFKLHAADSLLLGIVAILSLPFSVLCAYLINKFFTFALPTYIKVGTEIVLTPETEFWPYLLCMVLTLICSILSALIPFMFYRRKKHSAERTSKLSADE